MHRHEAENIRGSHRTARLQTYDDLIESDVLLEIQPANRI